VDGESRANGEGAGLFTMRTADAYPFPTQPAPLRFAVALAAAVSIFLIDSTFEQAIDDGSHFLLLATVVLGSAWFAGTGPALAATVVGAILGAWDAQADARATQTHLALFIVHGLLLTALVAELRRARRVSEQKARDAQEARHDSEAAGRMKDEFLATISHELRTPLNAVLGWLHLLRTAKLDAATASRGLESIERNVRLQAQLTGDLLDISKVLTGQLHLDTKTVSLAEACRQAVDSALPIAQAKGVDVSCSVPSDALPVLGDGMRLRQIMWQLVANAIKFTPRGGSVRLTVERQPDDGMAIVQVVDSGPGIDPQFLPRIFDQFTQQDPSPTRSAGGLGVGLSLVRYLVELHGGEIAAANRESGEGAAFTVRLPLNAGQVERLPDMPAAETLPATPLEGLRVLVLDQDADGRELLQTVLQERGAVVRTADSVAAALEALEAWRPDVLVSDAATPEHDTYALVGKVRSLERDRGGRIPAAALTAFARTDGRVRRMLESFQRYVPKPVEPSVLTAEIARLTGRAHRLLRRVN
jgi:signal transduction histidine kinase/ActR/RegA family two-component response regulator